MGEITKILESAGTINWSAYQWSLQCGGLRAARFLTQQLSAPRESFKKPEEVARLLVNLASESQDVTHSIGQTSYDLGLKRKRIRLTSVGGGVKNVCQSLFDHSSS